MAGRRWLIVAGLLGVVLGGLPFALPALVRWVVIRQATALTGQRVVLEDVDVNLFTRRLVLIGFALGDEGYQPLASFDRLDARFELLPLLRGHLRLPQATLHAPRVTVIRTEDGRVTLAPVLERLSARPGGGGLDLTVEHGRVEGGRIVFQDRRVRPARTWEATDVAVELRGVSTRADAPEGSATATLVVAGAPAHVAADDLRLRPFGTRARVTVTGLDLAPTSAYLDAGALVRITGGRASGRWTVHYDAAGGLQGDGRVTVEGLALERTGHPGLVITAPAVVMRSRHATYRDGTVAVEHFDLSAEPTLQVASAAGRRQYALDALRAVLQNVTYPASTPGRITVTARLPAGGAFEARGQVTPSPLAADLRVTMRDVAIALARPYLPARMPVTIDRGRLHTALDVRYGNPGGLLVNGDLALRELVLLRRGQTVPFITHRVLQARVHNLRLTDAGLALERLTMRGAPRIVDASVEPPQRLVARAVSLTVEALTVPSRAPARVRGAATLGDGGAVRLHGRMDVSTLAVDVRVAASDIALARLAGYLGPDSPLALQGGFLDTQLRLVHDPAKGAGIEGQGAITDLAVGRAGMAGPLLTAPRLALTVDGLRPTGAGVTAERLAAEGAPVLHATTGGAPRQIPLRSLQILVSDFSWPGRRPATTRLLVELPDAGTLTADGALDLDAGAFTATVEVAGGALGPYRDFLPVAAPITGLLEARLALEGTLAGPALRARGTARARDLTLGRPEQPTIAVEAIDLAGLDAQWPGRIQAERLVIHRPSALIEREADGEFPLQAMLRPPEDDAPAASPSTAPEGWRADSAPAAPAFAVGEIALENGQARFVDRASRPYYSEELTQLDVRVEGLTSDRGAVAEVAIRGVLGAEAVLELDGVVAPFGKPFFLEVTGQLRQFHVPRTNPLLRRFLETTARSGELSTELHYRITGNQLEATNHVLVERLAIQQADDDRVGRAIGLPLGLIVSLLKNPAGEIRLTIPVEGELGSPRFSFGDAILTVLRNVVTRLATAPLRAIGRLIQRDTDTEAKVEIEPATFEPGSAVVTPGAAQHLQRVADVLRASPYVRLGLQPVVSEADVQALRAQAAAAEVERMQRESGVADFATAARELFRHRLPHRPPPPELPDLMAALAENTDVPPGVTDNLAAKRAWAVQRVLTEEAGIEAGRLEVRRAGPEAAPGTPRVEFELLPAG